MRAALLGLFLLAGCASGPLDEAVLREKESLLNKIAAGLEAAVRFGEPPASLAEEDLLALAVKADPGRLEAFRDYRLRVRREGRLSSVLVCTADGRRALWEDAGCTPPLDLRLWDQPAAACGFRLDLERTCR